MTTGRLALLKEAIPNLARVGVIGNSGNYGTPAYLEKCHAWAQTVGATLQIYDLRDPNDTAPIFTKMAGDRVEALIAFPDSVIFGQRDNIVQTALRSSLPLSTLSTPSAGILDLPHLPEALRTGLCPTHGRSPQPLQS